MVKPNGCVNLPTGTLYQWALLDVVADEGIG